MKNFTLLHTAWVLQPQVLLQAAGTWVIYMPNISCNKYVYLTKYRPDPLNTRVPCLLEPHHLRLSSPKGEGTQFTGKNQEMYIWCLPH